jgi:hypothetical protein
MGASQIANGPVSFVTRPRAIVGAPGKRLTPLRYRLKTVCAVGEIFSTSSA